MPKMPKKSCPFCQSKMDELPDRALVLFVAKEDVALWTKTPYFPDMLRRIGTRIPTVAHACVGCGFVALFEV
jgi:hypothetical protein